MAAETALISFFKLLKCALTTLIASDFSLPEELLMIIPGNETDEDDGGLIRLPSILI